MTAVQIAQTQIEQDKATKLARFRRAVYLMGKYEGNPRAARLYLAISKELGR